MAPPAPGVRQDMISFCPPVADFRYSYDMILRWAYQISRVVNLLNYHHDRVRI